MFLLEEDNRSVVFDFQVQSVVLQVSWFKSDQAEAVATVEGRVVEDAAPRPSTSRL
jgi:hypothetical protein